MRYPLGSVASPGALPRERFRSLLWFLDAGNNDCPARSTGRRPKSEGTKSRGHIQANWLALSSRQFFIITGDLFTAIVKTRRHTDGHATVFGIAALSVRTMMWLAA